MSKEVQGPEINLKTIEEMAERLSVPRSWIYARTRKNEIPCIRVGKYLRFREDEVMEWLEGQQEH